MGKYINDLPDGTSLGVNTKLDRLLDYGAEIIDTPTSFQPDIVCVVQNAEFQAAAYMYSPAELKSSLQDDGREKTWIHLPGAQDLAN
jgi:hypothetical protein